MKSCLHSDIDLFMSVEFEIARLGGDEFVILLDSIKDVDEAVRVADRLKLAFSEPFDLNGHEVFTSASIGIACGDGNVEHAADLLREADAAMYRAKSEGKARHVIFDQSMHDQAKQRLEMESDLRRAIASDQFVFHYQPVV